MSKTPATGEMTPSPEPRSRNNAGDHPVDAWFFYAKTQDAERSDDYLVKHCSDKTRIARLAKEYNFDPARCQKLTQSMFTKIRQGGTVGKPILVMLADALNLGDWQALTQRTFHDQLKPKDEAVFLIFVDWIHCKAIPPAFYEGELCFMKWITKQGGLTEEQRDSLDHGDRILCDKLRGFDLSPSRRESIVLTLCKTGLIYKHADGRYLYSRQSTAEMCSQCTIRKNRFRELARFLYDKHHGRHERRRIVGKRVAAIHDEMLNATSYKDYMDLEEQWQLALTGGHNISQYMSMLDVAHSFRRTLDFVHKVHERETLMPFWYNYFGGSAREWWSNLTRVNNCIVREIGNTLQDGDIATPDKLSILLDTMCDITMENIRATSNSLELHRGQLRAKLNYKNVSIDLRSHIKSIKLIIGEDVFNTMFGTKS